MLDYNRQVGPVIALLLADQAYNPSNSPEWIVALRPQALLLSVSTGDQDDRPDREILEAAQGYTLLRTDQNGWIELITDGVQTWARWRESRSTPEKTL